MIGRQVGVDGDVEINFINASLIESVRRYFHHRRDTPLFQHLTKQPVVDNHFGGGVRRIIGMIANDVLDGADESLSFFDRGGGG